MSDALRDTVLSAAGNDALAAELAAFYERLDATIERHAPLCTNRALCCNFKTYGHDLFVTVIELAVFLRAEGGAVRSSPDGDRCPYHVDGVCTARGHRPMGCRVFFCDPAAQSWQHDEYERRLAELKQIGQRHGVDYAYVEWLSALERLAGDQNLATGGDRPHDGQFVDPRRLKVIESPARR